MHSLSLPHPIVPCESSRKGESALISGYLGQGDTFDKAIAQFSAAYADQSERDRAVLMKAVRNGTWKS